MAPATDIAAPILTDERSRKFKVIAFALDLTGKKLIDEIFHISACQEDGSAFDQYIMTYRDLSQSVIRTHGVRIVTMLGKYRVMKDAYSMRSIQTKSEYAALNDFLSWLRQQKGSAEAIVLAYHDQGSAKVTPFLIEALQRYDMTDEFFQLVKGFVNSCQIASTQPENKGRSLALGNLARRVLGMDDRREKPESRVPDVANGKRSSVSADPQSHTERSKFTDRSRSERQRRNRSAPREQSRGSQMHSAKVRAATTYKLLRKFTPDSQLFEPSFSEFITTQEQELNFAKQQRELAAKVRSLRPIFVDRIRVSPRERSRAVLLRQYLIEIAADYDSLKKAFETLGAEEIQRIVETSSAKKKKPHQDELVELIVSHFGTKPEVDNPRKVVRENGAGDHGRVDSGTSTESDGEEFEDANSGS